MSFSKWVGCLMVAVLAIAGSHAPLRAGEASITLGDLQVAHNRECNAQHSYLHYAEQADIEGYHKLASLMRAVARGEGIHAASSAADIVRLGGKPKAEMETVALASLRTNLGAAIAQEEYERDHMYVMFSSQARQEKKQEAQDSFYRYRYAESTHAKLFQEALAGFDNMKQAGPFLVCPGCGAVTTEVEGGACIGCGLSAEKFETVL